MILLLEASEIFSLQTLSLGLLRFVSVFIISCSSSGSCNWLCLLLVQTWDPEEGTVLGRRASLSDLNCVDDIEALSVRQLKEILARNFVNYKGCCEKWELMERVTRLYQDQQNLLGEYEDQVTMLRCRTKNCTEEILFKNGFRLSMWAETGWI